MTLGLTPLSPLSANVVYGCPLSKCVQLPKIKKLGNNMYYLYSLLSLEIFFRQNGNNYNKFVFLRTRAIPTSAPKPYKAPIPKPSKTPIVLKPVALNLPIFVPKPRIRLMLPTPPTFVPKRRVKLTLPSTKNPPTFAPKSMKLTPKTTALLPSYSNLQHWISTRDSKSAAALKSPIHELLSNVFAAQFVLPELKQLDFIDKFAFEEPYTKPRLDKKFSAENYKNGLNYVMRIM